MKNIIITGAALATLLSIGTATVAQAQEKEKCYGIAAAGKNDCGNLAGTHSCAGQSKKDNDPGEWKFVKKGECTTMKGLTKAEAEKAVASAKK